MEQDALAGVGKPLALHHPFDDPEPGGRLYVVVLLKAHDSVYKRVLLLPTGMDLS